MDVVQAVSHGFSVYDVLDTYGHTEAYFDTLFGQNDPDFNEQLLDVFDHEVSARNLLILDRLEILPNYRGCKMGLSIIRHQIARFSAGAGVVAIKPFPLQFESSSNETDEKNWRADMMLDKLSGSVRSATEKLCDYYVQLGFRRIARTPFLAVSTDWNLTETCSSR